MRHFYTHYFIHGHPPGPAIVPLTRTVGQHRLVDELVYRFTHIGSIDSERLLVTGGEAARKVVEAARGLSNVLITRGAGVHGESR